MQIRLTILVDDYFVFWHYLLAFCASFLVFLLPETKGKDLKVIIFNIDFFFYQNLEIIFQLKDVEFGQSNLNQILIKFL